jgi:hypothetical protein
VGWERKLQFEQLEQKEDAGIFSENEVMFPIFKGKIEAEKDEILARFLENVLREHQFSLSDPKHAKFLKNHKICVTLCM